MTTTITEANTVTLTAPHIIYHWTRDRGDGGRTVELNGKTLGFFPLQSGPESHQFDCVTIELKRSTVSNGRHHYNEGNTDVAALDCKISIDRKDGDLWPTELLHFLPYCARLEISFPLEKKNHLLIFYKKWHRGDGHVDSGEWQSKMIRYR